MSSSEKFCLRWNDFESNISVAFREIREEKDFFDCTLSCGARQIQAHKLILSACSPFFRSILRQNPHQHPLLYLKGVEFTDLQAVLNFMYHGEVNVAQEELNSFLAVAEDLQVKGLTQNNSEPNSATQKTKTEAQSQQKTYTTSKEPEPPNVSKRPRPKVPPPTMPTYQEPSAEDDILEVMPTVKQEPQAVSSQEAVSYSSSGFVGEGGLSGGTQVASMEESYAEEGYDDYASYEGEMGYDGMGAGEAGQAEQNSKGYSTYIERTMTGYTCTACGKEFRDQSNCRRHVKEKHFGQDQDTCPLCCKILSKRYIQDHIKRCSVQM